MRPVPHTDNPPVFIPSAHKYLIHLLYEEFTSEENFAKSVSSEGNVFVYLGVSDSELYWIAQEDQSDLVCDLYLSKKQSELLAFRPNQWNLVTADIRIIIQDIGQGIIEIDRYGKQVVLLHQCLWVVHLPWLPTQSYRLASFYKLFQVMSEGCALAQYGNTFLFIRTKLIKKNHLFT